jgi:hypothetical protein
MAAGVLQRWLGAWKEAFAKSAPTPAPSTPQVPPQDTAQQRYLTMLAESRRSLEAESYKVEAEYDKTIITLAGGALGVSMAFLKDIAHNPDASTLWLLRGSWVLFSLTLLSTLVSMLTSQSAFDDGIEYTTRRIDDAAGEGVAANRSPSDEELERSLGSSCKRTRWLNRASAGLFVLGALFLVFFTVSNVPTADENDGKPNASAEGSNHGEKRIGSKSAEATAEKVGGTAKSTEVMHGDEGRGQPIGTPEAGANQGSGGQADRDRAATTTAPATTATVSTTR